MASSTRQKEHYERIHEEYESHYYDAQSMLFRQQFFYDPLFHGIDFNRRAVLDLAAGSGYNSLELLRRFPKAEVTGLDISGKACEAYRRNVGRPCIEADLTRSLDSNAVFDAAMIVGGLHHCVTDLPQTLRNLSRLLKPGGYLLMIEPNKEFILEWARQIWYRFDKYFDVSTEAALVHSALVGLGRPHFAVESIRFCGGPAYFLISQSLLFRLPKAVKRASASTLMRLEAIYNHVPSRWLHPYFIARWTRSADPTRVPS